jgi:hypothetical protein
VSRVIVSTPEGDRDFEDATYVFADDSTKEPGQHGVLVTPAGSDVPTWFAHGTFSQVCEVSG